MAASGRTPRLQPRLATWLACLQADHAAHLEECRRACATATAFIFESSSPASAASGSASSHPPTSHLQEALAEIDRDVLRTFPHHPRFACPPELLGPDGLPRLALLSSLPRAHALSQLRVALFAVAVLLRPEVSYCQGQNYFAAACMLLGYEDVLGGVSDPAPLPLPAAEDVTASAVALMTALMGHEDAAASGSSTAVGSLMSLSNFSSTSSSVGGSLGLSDVWRPGLPRLRVLSWMLAKLLRQRHPLLHDHLTRVGFDTQVLASQWFLTLLATALPLPTLGVVYGWLVLDGWAAFFGLVLALLAALEPFLLDMDVAGVADLLREWKIRVVDSPTPSPSSSPAHTPSPAFLALSLLLNNPVALAEATAAAGVNAATLADLEGQFVTGVLTRKLAAGLGRAPFPPLFEAALSSSSGSSSASPPRGAAHSSSNSSTPAASPPAGSGPMTAAAPSSALSSRLTRGSSAVSLASLDADAPPSAAASWHATSAAASAASSPAASPTAHSRSAVGFTPGGVAAATPVGREERAAHGGHAPTPPPPPTPVGDAPHAKAGSGFSLSALLPRGGVQGLLHAIAEAVPGVPGGGGGGGSRREGGSSESVAAAAADAVSHAPSLGHGLPLPERLAPGSPEASTALAALEDPLALPLECAAPPSRLSRYLALTAVDPQAAPLHAWAARVRAGEAGLWSDPLLASLLTPPQPAATAKTEPVEKKEAGEDAGADAAATPPTPPLAPLAVVSSESPRVVAPLARAASKTASLVPGKAGPVLGSVKRRAPSGAATPPAAVTVAAVSPTTHAAVMPVDPPVPPPPPPPPKPAAAPAPQPATPQDQALQEPAGPDGLAVRLAAHVEAQQPTHAHAVTPSAYTHGVLATLLSKHAQVLQEAAAAAGAGSAAPALQALLAALRSSIAAQDGVAAEEEGPIPAVVAEQSHAAAAPAAHPSVVLSHPPPTLAPIAEEDASPTRFSLSDFVGASSSSSSEPSAPEQAEDDEGGASPLHGGGGGTTPGSSPSVAQAGGALGGAASGSFYSHRHLRTLSGPGDFLAGEEEGGMAGSDKNGRWSVASAASAAARGPVVSAGSVGPTPSVPRLALTESTSAASAAAVAAVLAAPGEDTGGTKTSARTGAGWGWGATAGTTPGGAAAGGAASAVSSQVPSSAQHLAPPQLSVTSARDTVASSSSRGGTRASSPVSRASVSRASEGLLTPSASQSAAARQAAAAAAQARRASLGGGATDDAAGAAVPAMGPLAEGPQDAGGAGPLASPPAPTTVTAATASRLPGRHSFRRMLTDFILEGSAGGRAGGAAAASGAAAAVSATPARGGVASTGVPGVGRLLSPQALYASFIRPLSMRPALSRRGSGTAGREEEGAGRLPGDDLQLPHDDASGAIGGGGGDDGGFTLPRLDLTIEGGGAGGGGADEHGDVAGPLLSSSSSARGHASHRTASSSSSLMSPSSTAAVEALNAALTATATALPTPAAAAAAVAAAAPLWADAARFPRLDASPLFFVLLYAAKLDLDAVTTALRRDAAVLVEKLRGVRLELVAADAIAEREKKALDVAEAAMQRLLASKRRTAKKLTRLITEGLPPPVASPSLTDAFLASAGSLFSSGSSSAAAASSPSSPSPRAPASSSGSGTEALTVVPPPTSPEAYKNTATAIKRMSELLSSIDAQVKTASVAWREAVWAHTMAATKPEELREVSRAITSQLLALTNEADEHRREVLLLVWRAANALHHLEKAAASGGGQL